MEGVKRSKPNDKLLMKWVSRISAYPKFTSKPWRSCRKPAEQIQGLQVISLSCAPFQIEKRNNCPLAHFSSNDENLGFVFCSLGLSFVALWTGQAAVYHRHTLGVFPLPM
mmetsp:Transcript_2905/g.7547  ORF Transcript_2905/g.7547 Transcript_2905/m.7547 type:complete len:110 (+) Transcript_2905:1147-1476(+)